MHVDGISGVGARPAITIDLNPGGNAVQAEAKARQTYPEVAQHPDLFKDIRDFSQRAGLARIPLVTIAPSPLQVNNAGARTNPDGTTEICVSPSILSKRSPLEVAGGRGPSLL